MTALSDEPHVGLLVEGPGDLRAVPHLVRRVAIQKKIFDDIVGKPVACHGRSNVDRPGGLEKFAGIVSSRPGCKAILIVLDSDEDCPVRLASNYLARLEGLRIPAFICLIVKNWEDLLFSSAETLGLDLEFSEGSSGLRMIKEAMRPEKYVKPTHQTKLTERVDLDLASSRMGSAARLIRCIEAALMSAVDS